MGLTISITVVLSVLFLIASSIKILGWQKTIFETQLEFFISYGLNRQIMRLVGLVELFGAVGIWFHGTLMGVLAVLALVGTSLGAIYCHLRFDTWKAAIPASITLALSATVLYFVPEPLSSLVSTVLTP